MTKYIIRRTSGWYDEKPCDGAVLEELYCWNVRTRSKAIMQTDHPYDDYDDYEYINNINFHYFCGNLNKLKRNSENMFELNHNTYTEFYEAYIPSTNFLFSGKIYFNEDLNIQSVFK